MWGRKGKRKGRREEGPPLIFSPLSLRGEKKKKGNEKKKGGEGQKREKKKEKGRKGGALFD